MALYSKVEFAGICELTVSNLGVYIKRKKVILSGDYIDDVIPENKLFLEKRLTLSLKKTDSTQDQVNEGSRSLNIQPPAERTILKPNVKSPKADGSQINLTELTRQKLIIEIEKRREETDLLKIRKDKLIGEVIPIVLATQLLTVQNQSMVTCQKDGMDELLINFAKEVRLSGAQLAKLRGIMVNIINEGSDKAIKMTARQLKTIVDEYSQKREVGEHE